MNFKSIFLIIITISLIFSCGEKKKSKEAQLIEDLESAQDTSLSLEERIKRHVEADLKISANEHYSLRVYKENLDGDNKQDAIITVNRLEFAMNNAEQINNTAKLAEIGFFGNYNYIFYYDGGLDKISPGIIIMSSPVAELKIDFVNLMSGSYKDIVMDYKIKNASFKDYLTVVNHTPKIVFEWNEYDYIGTSKPTANCFELVEKNVGLAKDIVVYKGEVLNNSLDIIDFGKFIPVIKKKEKLYTFFYSTKLGKYATLDKK